MIIKIIILLLLAITINGCNILALSGGGAHGSAEVGIISKLIIEGKKWDIITGVSVGAINAGLLSMFEKENQHIGIIELSNLWFNLTNQKIYTLNINPIYSGSIFNNYPLYNTIHKTLNPYNGIPKITTFISATNMNTGEYHIFNNKEMTNITNTVNIIIASSSIPIFFPPKFHNENYYMDGGLFSNIMIDTARRYCNNTNITIDVALTGKPLNILTNEQIKKYTIVGNTVRAINIMSNSLFNHEIYFNDCSDGIDMNIYLPSKELHGGLFDFNKKDIIYNYNAGYNYVYHKTKYCV